MVLGDECSNFGIDGRLQHSPGSLSDQFTEWTFLIELSSKGNNFWIERFVREHGVSVCLSLVYGLSMCPLWAAEM